MYAIYSSHLFLYKTQQPTFFSSLFSLLSSSVGISLQPEKKDLFSSEEKIVKSFKRTIKNIFICIPAF